MWRIFSPPDNIEVLLSCAGLDTAAPLEREESSMNLTLSVLEEEKINLRKESLTKEEISLINQIVRDVSLENLFRSKITDLQPKTAVGTTTVNSYFLCLQAANDKIVNNDNSLKPSLFCTIHTVDVIMGNGVNTLEFCNDEENKLILKLKNTDKFSKIYFPFHAHYHFTLIVYDSLAKEFQYYDSAGTGSSGNFLLKVNKIKRYLVSNTPLENCDGYTARDLSGICGKQNNAFDCGVFCMMFADFVSDSLPVSRVLQIDMPCYRLKIQNDLIQNNVKYCYLTSNERTNACSN
jgi:hypothetical protein